MKTIFTFSILALVAIVAAACTSKKTVEPEAAKKSLVLYYSQTGTTKVVAEEIQRLTGADIEAFDVEEPYDGDFGATVARVQREKSAGTQPKLKALKSKLADYDIIYIGYPIWSGSYATPVASLVKEYDFAGKKIIPFCSFGSGGLEVSVNDLRKALPKAEVADGYGVRTARTAAVPAEVDRFLKENKYIKGTVEALPDFSEQQLVGDAEKALFNQACSSYQFPLGTPVSFGKREIKGGTEYKFAVNNQTTIYVVTTQVDGKTNAEFTRVVR